VKNVTDIAVLPEGATLVLQAGKRTLSLKADDLEHYKVSVDVVVTNCHVASSGWMRCSSKTSIRRKRPLEASIYDLTRRSTLWRWSRNAYSRMIWPFQAPAWPSVLHIIEYFHCGQPCGGHLDGMMTALRPLF
jgi:hypothetical protein